MKKALDYLYGMKKANEDMGTEPVTIIEAIKELKEIQDRSCDNCIQKKCPMYKEALNYSVVKSKNDFSCNKWSAK